MTTESLFAIPKMDCPSEERLIRLSLADTPGVASLQFDLVSRELRVFHEGPVEDISGQLGPLGLGAKLLNSSKVQASQHSDLRSTQPTAGQEAQVLKWLLGINAGMFIVEMGTGWLAQSTGLIADSLDMFADAAVYGLALHAVGRAAGHKMRAARLAGWLQVLLALGAMFEILRRLVMGSDPEPPLMMGIALVALLANLSCLALLSRHRGGGVHMRASWIFSTNDVLANIGVIVAGWMVGMTGSRYPDLIIAAIIAVLVLNGARRILRLQA
jgi:Co/Zn/Cd efflux system component